MLTLGEETDAGEKRLLLAFTEMLRELDPDVVEGHNIFKFDLDYLRTRAKRHKVPCAWGRVGRLSRARAGARSPVRPAGRVPQQPHEGGGALD
ncbi:MAG: 3'-5' exonuclease [bacterium]|nr:3'-5' exonuclease [bacterium]